MSTAQLKVPSFAASVRPPDWKESSKSEAAPVNKPATGVILPLAPHPDTAQPGASPASAPSGALQPGTSQPGTSQPSSTPSSVSQAGTGQSGVTQAGETKASARPGDDPASDVKSEGSAPEDLVTKAGAEQPDGEGEVFPEGAGAQFRRLAEAPEIINFSAAGVLGATWLAYAPVESPPPKQQDSELPPVEPPNSNRPFVFVTDVDAFERSAGGVPGKIVFIIALSEAPLAPVTVSFRTEDVDATGGLDYEPMTGTISFQPGQSAVFIEVPVFDDTLVEDTELMRLVLFDPVGAEITDADGFATITDDDSIPATPEISISDVDGAEDVSGAPVMRFIVSLSGTTSVPVTVDFTTEDVDATAGQDYVPVSGTITFAPGESTAVIEVPVINDSTPEGTELFRVVLSNPLGAIIIDEDGFGSIDDEGSVVSSALGAPHVLALSGAEAAEAARAVEFDVTLSAPARETVTIEFATLDQEAIGGVDYAPISGTITFLPGQTRATLAVEVYNDRVFELDDAFSVELGEARGGEIAVGEVGFGLGRVAADGQGLAHYAPQQDFDLSEVSELMSAERGEVAGFGLPDLEIEGAATEPRIALSLAARWRGEGIGTAGEESLTAGPMIDQHAPIQMQHALAATVAAERLSLDLPVHASHHAENMPVTAADIIETGDILWLPHDSGDVQAAYAGRHDDPLPAELSPVLQALEPELPLIGSDY